MDLVGSVICLWLRGLVFEHFPEDLVLVDPVLRDVLDQRRCIFELRFDLAILTIDTTTQSEYHVCVLQ